MTEKQSFARGAFILSVSAFITRMIGFANSIILARLLGAEGIGLLMMAHPLVPIVITLTSLGLPVAISKLVAEAEARGERQKVKRILIVSLAVTVAVSIVLTVLSFLGADWIASWLLTDRRAYYAMLAITPIAPLVAVSSVLRGYFRGRQNMKPLAVSDVIEQIVRIALIAALVQMLLPLGVEYAAAGAMISTVIGEGAGLLYLMFMFELHKKRRGLHLNLSPRLKQEKQTLVELLQIGLPTTGQGFISSIYRAFQPVIVMKSLALAGIGTVIATKQFGMLAGYAFPLLVFPSFVMHSLSTALLPAVSEARSKRNGMEIQQRVDQAMRIALLIGAPCTVILFIWAVPLTTVVYRSPEAGHFLKMLAPIFFLQYFEPPLHAVLLGLGRVSAAMWNFMISTAFKAAAVFILGSRLGMDGVVWGINFGVFLITALNLLSVSKSIGFSADVRHAVKVAIGLCVMALVGQSVYVYLLKAELAPLWIVVGTIGAAIVVYIMSLLATQAIQRKDVQHIPLLKKLVS
ncbi:stage V sporulation protein B [Paenibacillus thalictri]|uniref:Stage V sporulation protein B n=1 Tax=Paenibacillus thalictri TaxID=2527873 RepID=A0A4Q9DVD6_9BACL|nr:stage V sporulation protein B [Paenibacillus thalictri]TBL79578.1 stage V sporulation protein B [Paenibacillus thalictri]